MKYNKSEIMKQAWSLYRTSKKWVDALDFAECLRRAWQTAKKAIEAAKEIAANGIVRMHYSQYKAQYSNYKTVEGSYDKRTKTIEVMTKTLRKGGNAVINGLCPHCHTYCFGECRAH